MNIFHILLRIYSQLSTSSLINLPIAYLRGGDLKTYSHINTDCVFFSSLFFCCCVKHHYHKQVGMKWTYLFYKLRSIIAGSQVRNQRQTIEAETMEEYCLAADSKAHSCSATFPIQPAQESYHLHLAGSFYINTNQGNISQTLWWVNLVDTIP